MNNDQAINSTMEDLLQRRKERSNNPLIKNLGRPEPPKEKVPKVNKTEQALKDVQYTYAAYHTRKDRIGCNMTSENAKHIDETAQSAGINRTKALNKILDEHRALNAAGAIPGNVAYTYNVVSASGVARTPMRISLSTDNMEYLSAYMTKNGLAKQASAINKIIDEHRAVKY